MYYRIFIASDLVCILLFRNWKINWICSDFCYLIAVNFVQQVDYLKSLQSLICKCSLSLIFSLVLYVISSIVYKMESFHFSQCQLSDSKQLVYSVYSSICISSKMMRCTRQFHQVHNLSTSKDVFCIWWVSKYTLLKPS